jgi:predicted permease
MNWLRELGRRLYMLLRCRQFDADLEEEMRLHRQLREQAEIERGLSPKEAHYAAQRRFGNDLVLREESREMWRWNWLENLGQDIRYALRMLVRNRGFTAVTVITLALGIGANTAIYSLAYSVLFRDLPVKDPQRLVVMKGLFPKWPAGYSQNGHGMGTTFSYPAYRSFSDQRRVFVSVFGFAPPDIGKENLTVDVDGRATTANGVMVTGTYFTGLGVTSTLGRVIAPSDEAPGATRVADISFGYWVRAFGQSLTVIGKRVAINRTPFTIVGVLPRAFSGAEPGKAPGIWIPITANGNLGPWGGMSASEVFGRGTFAWMTIMGRLQPGVSRSQAASAATLAFQQNLEASLGRQFRPDEMPRVELSPAGRGLDSLREAFSKPLLVLMALAGFLLLLASANVAALLLARGAARRGEMAIRAALGAGRSRLIGQLLTEGVVLAAVGGAAGVAIAYWGAHGLAALLTSGNNQIAIRAELGSHVLPFLALVSLLAGILVGIVPALRGAAHAPISALKIAGTSRSSAGRARWFGWGDRLVVAQVALSLLLLATAGLFVRTLRNAEAEDTGINPRHLLLFGINPVGYEEQQAEALYQRLLERLRALPGVNSVAVSRFTMFSGWQSTGEVSMVGYHPKPGQDMQVAFLLVGPGFFPTMGIPLLAGRSIEDSDLGRVPKGAVVNEEFARQFFGRASPIGQILESGSAQTPIVGVVRDAKYGNPLAKAPATVYLPTVQGFFEVRTNGDPLSIVPTIRGVLNTMAPGVPMTGVETEAHEIRGWFMQQRLLATLGAFFGLVGLLLSALGVYGLVSFRVARRTHEIGIRMALGAKPGDILRIVAGQGLRLTLIGVAIGVGGALALTRFLSSLLYGVKPTDAPTFVVVSLLLAAIGVLACYIPARRATKVDPMVALRYE